MMDATRENQARVLAGTGSPKILVGGINIVDGPNFHTRELIDLGASIVTIALTPEHALRPDRLYCPPDIPMQAALEALPRKWRPDFFYDSQVEQGHYLPVGLGQIECPTIVSFNHAHLGQALLHMGGMFDCVIAPSAFMSKWGDATLPWGASWGTMEKRIEMLGKSPKGTPRDIDVSCTIGSSVFGSGSARHAVIAEMHRLVEARKDLKIAVLHGASQEEYFDVLRWSKVSINVGSWGAPMTYRPLEIINQEAVMVHVDETGYGSRSPLSDFFEPHWYVQSTPETLEASIDDALRMCDKATEIKREVISRYSYAEQFSDLFKLASGVQKKERLTPREWSRRAFAVNYLTGYPQYAAVHEWALSPDDRASMYAYRDHDWDVCLWAPGHKDDRVEWQTDLARAEEPARDTYKRFATKEKQ